MRYLILIAVTFLLFSCETTEIENAEMVVEKARTIDAKKIAARPDNLIEDSVLVKELSAKIILLLKDKKLKELAEFIHPKRALLFSPYAYVNEPRDVYDKTSFLKLIKSSEKIIFGFYDGSGELIELTFDEYYSKFIYNADYANAPQIAYNQFLASGNSLNNLKEFFSNAHFVEYYFLGFDKKYEGMDWQTLRLVFQKMDKQFYLIAIVHDQWTI